MQSHAEPLGQRVTDFCFRVEVPKMRSPHVHGFVWLEVEGATRAPQIYL